MLGNKFETFSLKPPHRAFTLPLGASSDNKTTMNKTELIENNPWKKFAKKVIKNKGEILEKFNGLDSDKNQIELFNMENNDIRFYTHMMPSHYTGNILDAKVILLALNPGYDKKEEVGFYNISKFRVEFAEHLLFQKNSMLSNDEERIKASDYWSKKLADLEILFPNYNISNEFALLQFNPYHSVKFGKKNKDFKINGKKQILKSQKFGFEILKYVIKKNKLIFVLRGRDIWFKMVPELVDYIESGNVYYVLNPRNPKISNKNVVKPAFQDLINKLNVYE